MKFLGGAILFFIAVLCSIPTLAQPITPPPFGTYEVTEKRLHLLGRPIENKETGNKVQLACVGPAENPLEPEEHDCSILKFVFFRADTDQAYYIGGPIIVNQVGVEPNKKDIKKAVKEFYKDYFTVVNHKPYSGFRDFAVHFGVYVGGTMLIVAIPLSITFLASPVFAAVALAVYVTEIALAPQFLGKLADTWMDGGHGGTNRYTSFAMDKSIKTKKINDKTFKKFLEYQQALILDTAESTSPSVLP